MKKKTYLIQRVTILDKALSLKNLVMITGVWRSGFVEIHADPKIFVGDIPVLNNFATIVEIELTDGEKLGFMLDDAPDWFVFEQVRQYSL